VNAVRESSCEDLISGIHRQKNLGILEVDVVSLLSRLFGLEDNSPTQPSSDTETLRRIIREVDRLDPSEARHLNGARYHNLTTLWFHPSVVGVRAYLRAASSFSAAAWNALSSPSRFAPSVTRRLTLPGFLRRSSASCPTLYPKRSTPTTAPGAVSGGCTHW